MMMMMIGVKEVIFLYFFDMNINKSICFLVFLHEH